MELRMYRYRIYPSQKQKVRIINSLKTCKTIYNELLAMSIDSWKYGKVSLSGFDFNKYLTGKYLNIHSQSKQNVSDRVHKAFRNFFRRVKSKEKKKGFPRFKSRVNSITFPQYGFKLLSDKRIKLSKIGSVPIVLHRIPKGKIKTLTIKQNKASEWFATFACEIESPKVKHQSSEKVGIDLGIESYAVLSDGEFVKNPRHINQSEKRLKRLHRLLSRKKKGSANRRKARFRLAKQYIQVVDQRTDFLHKLAHRITQSYSFIAVEDLDIKKMVKTHWMAKSITDASWYSFIQMLSYKAVACGGQLVKVNPRNTSKMCSGCGTIVKMPLKKRKFLCLSCGFSSHRDLNASLNILKVGQDLPELNACEHSVRPSFKAVVDETGTIHSNS